MLKFDPCTNAGLVGNARSALEDLFGATVEDRCHRAQMSIDPLEHG